jgi:uncharacterized protein with FMN-binding domain
MSSAKIFVLHKKDLIRAGAIALAALALIIMLLVFLTGRRTEPVQTSLYTPGTYSSTIILNDEPLHVRVTVSENEILSVFLSDLGETTRVFYPLFEPRMHDLAEEILRYQSAHITPLTDYPVTTGILQHAVQSALELAAAGCCCDSMLAD